MKTLLITPPLTQLNTPYPATAYLTGFLRSQGLEAHQADLGIELVTRLFSGEVLARMFEHAAVLPRRRLSPDTRRVLAQRDAYVSTIDTVMGFLRGRDPALASRIVAGSLLPQSPRLSNTVNLDWAFGALGLTERARHLATLYLEDLTYFIAETISPGFQLGRYAEQLSITAPTFDLLAQALGSPPDLVDALMLELLHGHMARLQPDLVGFTIPFPGNLYAALRCGQYLKAHFPATKVVWGGGFVSTELRQLSDPHVFDYVDYLVLDAGEPALLRLIEHLDGRCGEDDLCNVIVRRDGHARRLTAAPAAAEPATPDYRDLPLDSYVSLIEVANPAHKLWSDGRWNKMILARGCYWAKCAFCDTALSYIADYRPEAASVLVDRMETVMQQTGSRGFHFVDEAAPPKVLRGVATELLRRELQVTWWTNIRFERSFTAELCALMAKAGCIAVSGGLEVASNRVLSLMNKGVTVEQAAAAAANLSRHGILVHAYLMYGFPGQTARETVDGLEVVRQLFAEGWLQSAFWHRYAMTVHSPSGMHPDRYGARRLDTGRAAPFANNEVPFSDGQSLDLEMLGEGLRRATYNYMHGLGLDLPVTAWFDGRVPRSSLRRRHLRNAVAALETGARAAPQR